MYFPHHHPMKYRRSRKSNDASAWTEIEQKTFESTRICLGEKYRFPNVASSTSFRSERSETSSGKEAPVAAHSA